MGLERLSELLLDLILVGCAAFVQVYDLHERKFAQETAIFNSIAAQSARKKVDCAAIGDF